MRGATAIPGSTAASAAAETQRTPATASPRRSLNTLFCTVQECDLRGRPRREFHMVRPAELLLREVDLERTSERMPVPSVGTQYLLIVRAGFIPLRQQAGGDIDTLAVPALRHHVDLPTRVFLVRFLRMLGVREVEVMGHAVHEGVDPEPFAVGCDGDIDRQGDFGRLSDRG